eukprot:gene41347-54799_t
MLINVDLFSKHISECENNLKLGSPHKFVDLDRVVKEILSIIYAQTPEETDSSEYRVPPLALIRLARGGKTATISKVFDELKKDSRVHPVLISFNGHGPDGFVRRYGATQSQSILRLIGAQLGDFTPAQAENLVVDSEALDRHLGQDDNVVLLIDELNSLGVPLDKDAARLLRDMFLDKAGRFLVFTSHIPVSIQSPIYTTGDFIGGTPSARGVSTVDMSLAKTESDFNELRNMSEKCEALTEERAAWLGYIPSLVFCAMNEMGQSGAMTPRDRFKQLKIAINNPKQKLLLLQGFVDELLTGDRHPDVSQFYSAFQSVGANFKVSYPLCYVKEIFGHLSCDDDTVKRLLCILNKLESHLDTKHSGIEWECTVQVAIILRMLSAHWFGYGGPFGVVASRIKPELAFHTLPSECDTVKAARTFIATKFAACSVPTLLYVDTANATLPELDGFVGYTTGDPSRVK